MKHARGLLLRNPEKIEPQEIVPPTPRNGEVLVEVRTVGLCGSDVHLYHGTYSGPTTYPLYFGHEWGGIVRGLGNGARKFSEGDRVVGDCSIFCGHCSYCQRDKNLCEQIQKFGITTDGASRGTFVQNQEYLYRLPDQFPLRLACLIEPLAVGLHAIRKVEDRIDKESETRILVLGGGAIGLSVASVLKNVYGRTPVHLFDVLPERTDRAVSMGCSKSDNKRVFDVAKDFDTGGYSGLYDPDNYDLVFETTGAPAALKTAISVAKPLGAVVMVGFIPDMATDYRLKQVTLKALTIKGSIGGTGEFERVIQAVGENPESFSGILTHEYNYLDYAAAFSTATDRKNAVKVALVFAGD